MKYISISCILKEYRVRQGEDGPALRESAFTMMCPCH